MVAVTYISEAMKAKVARRMRQAPVMDIVLSDEDSSSAADNHTPENKMKPMKSGKMITVGSAVIHKVTSGFSSHTQGDQWIQQSYTR